MSRRKDNPAPRPRAGEHKAASAGGSLLERRGPWIAGLFLALLLVVFFNPVFFGGQGFQPADQVASLAHRPFLEESFGGEGSLLERYPLWTPYIFSGMPSFGSLIAAPYTNPLSLLLTPIQGIFRILTYYFLLGLAMWWFLRRQDLAAIPALVGAVGFLFCAHVITLIMFGHNSKVATLIFLPLVLLATTEWWKSPRVLWFSLLGLFVGTMLVCSHLQIAYYTMLAAGLYLLVASVDSLRGKTVSPLGVLGRWAGWVGGLGLGLAASSVIFLPVREYAKYSIRGGTEGGLPYDYATNWSLHPVEMATFFMPSFMGYGGQSYWGQMPFTDFPHYMGVLVLLFAILTLVLWPRERFNLYLGLLAVLALILSFGRHVPVLYNLMFEFFPYFNKFRVPSMILFLTQFAVAALGAIGVHRLLWRDPGPDRERIWKRVLWTGGGALALVVVLGGIVAGGALDETISRQLVTRAGVYGVPQPQVGLFVGQQLEEVHAMAGRDTVVVGLFLVLGMALVWARVRGRIPGTVAAAALLILVVGDLWFVDHRPATYNLRSSDPDSFAPNSAVQFLQDAPGPYRILPLTGQGRNNNWFAYYRIESVLGYHPAKLKLYQDVIDEAGPVGIYKTTFQKQNFNVVNMLNMKYVVAEQEAAFGPLVPVHRGEWFVMENRDALPRMWFVDRVRVADEETQLRTLADPVWDPAVEALVVEDVGPIAPGSGGTAEVLEHSPREIKARVTSPGNCLLVVSEVYFPAGWYASIDGEPVDIHRADYLLRAVKVPAGTHELRMWFDPPLFRRAVYTSSAAYLLIVFGVVGSWLRSRRGRSTSR